jgi:hypothetical protein
LIWIDSYKYSTKTFNFSPRTTAKREKAKNKYQNYEERKRIFFLKQFRPDFLLAVSAIRNIATQYLILS